MKKKFPFSHLDRKAYLSTVSGVASTKPSLISYFDREIDAVSLITTKSFQVRENSGNREPIICEDEIGCWGNSVGLRNPGMEVALRDIKKLREKGLRKWLNISLSSDNPDDFITLVKAFSPYADSVELNFSCPHAKKGFGASIGSDITIASEYTRKINEATKDRECLLFIKLTPNVDDIASIAKAVVDNGADGIVAINTVGPEEHFEPITHKPILNNPIGGKGGVSGDGIFLTALKDITAIRKAVGDDVPIIGMGGVSDGERAAQLIRAGADAVGIGSALGRVNQKNWKEYLKEVKDEAEALLNNKSAEIKSRDFLRKDRAMVYVPHTVTKVTHHSADTIIIELSGEVDNFKAGEFVFLWVPELGEKPFSLARTNPLTLIIKKRGIFTSALLEKIHVGMEVFLRGPYGDAVETKKTKKALIILGGTGEAVAEPLSSSLEKDGTQMSFLVGTSEEGNKGIMEEVLRKKGSYKCISDDGKPGRVLDYIDSTLSSMLDDKTKLEDISFYLIGPEIFMKNGAKILKKKGVDSSSILLSMEKNSMCGVGLCGECAVGDRLMCQWGTFFTLSFLEEEGVL